MKNLPRLALLAVAAAISAGVAGSDGHGRPAAAADQLLGTMPPTAHVQFDLVLRLRTHALDHYLQGLYDPTSPLYGHYLAPASFGRRFGVPASAIASLRHRLTAAGLRIVAGYPQRTSLRVAGTVDSVRRVFGATLERYVTRTGRSYHTPDRRPVVPGSLARWVETVGGLDTRPLATPADVPYGALNPAEATSAYDVTPLYASTAGSVDGRGQTIAVMSVDTFSLHDLSVFSKQFGFLQAPPAKIVRIGAPDYPTSTEADLDAEVIRAVAPKARIVDYELATRDLAKTINRIVAQHKTSIVSVSFGLCDATSGDRRFGVHPIPRGLRTDVEHALEAAAAQGISFFVASGDSGAYDCQGESLADTNLRVDFPSDSPYVVSVGGTVVSVGSDGSYEGETAWGDLLSNSGGGGGLAPRDHRPSWQSGAQVTGISDGKRQVPDVAAAAGAGSPWAVYDGAGQSGWQAIGGTSAAAPFWAASMLLVQQYMEGHDAGPVCFAAPLLYGIAATQWRYPPFHDVSAGTNRYYAAGAGWDFATGLGSPDVYNLATAAVAYRTQHPLPGGSDACKSQASR